MRLLGFFFMTLVIATLAGCSGDDTTSSYTAYFYPDNTSPHDNSVSMQEGSRSGLSFHVLIDATEIDVSAVGYIDFGLRFCGEYFEYRNFSKGNFLEQQGSVDYTVTMDPGDPGLLHVTASLEAEVEGATGSGTFIELKFAGLKEGEDKICPFTFEQQRLLDKAPPEGRLVTGISWFGGKARVFK
jgi:hypothetical protein